MEYGSEYDFLANEAYLSTADTGFVRDDWQLYRSGRDAMKALARIADAKRVLLPALCCESMILPFAKNGYEVLFYRLNEDLSANEQDVLAKLESGSVLIYMRYFGIPAFSAEFLQSLKDVKKGVIIVEDRTHDILLPRKDESFIPDATLSSLRKWAALPDGGMLRTELGRCKAAEDGRFAALRRKAMHSKSRYLESWQPELKKEFLSELAEASDYLDESGEPVRMGADEEKLLRSIDFAKLLAARQRNALLLKALLSPLAKAGKLRFLNENPENSTLYFPIFLENRPAVQAAMAKRDIYCPVIWPEPEEAKAVCPVAEYVVGHMLAIPCDQRYDEADMHFIADTLAEILN